MPFPIFHPDPQDSNATDSYLFSLISISTAQQIAPTPTTTPTAPASAPVPVPAPAAAPTRSQALSMSTSTTSAPTSTSTHRFTRSRATTVPVPVPAPAPAPTRLHASSDGISTSASTFTFKHRPKPPRHPSLRNWIRGRDSILDILLLSTMRSASILYHHPSLAIRIWEWIQWWSNAEYFILDGHAYVQLSGTITFPSPKGLKINALPYTVGQPETLPRTLHGYIDMIKTCQSSSADWGKTYYITIYEHKLKAGDTYEICDIHVIPPPLVRDAGYHRKLSWNDGDRFSGGMYSASSISHTSAIWDCRIDPSYTAAIWNHRINPNIIPGSLEHLRSYIPGERHLTQENTLYWTSAYTPRSAIRVEHPCYIQYFQITTSPIGIWDRNIPVQQQQHQRMSAYGTITTTNLSFNSVL